jgi:hypothetical protein
MSQDWIDEGGISSLISHHIREAADGYDPGMVQIPTAFRGHDNRPVYLTASGFRDERKGDWMPREAMEAAQSIGSIHFPVDWNR